MRSAFFILVLVNVFFPSTLLAVPKEMPDDFTINYSFTGGKSPTYKNIELKIGESSCKYRMNFDDVPVEYTFQLKKEDLIPLYNELRSINAFNLKSKKIKVSDRGGESISYIIDKKNYHVSDSGMNFIISAHSSAFAKSALLITTLAARYNP